MSVEDEREDQTDDISVATVEVRGIPSSTGNFSAEATALINGEWVVFPVENITMTYNGNHLGIDWGGGRPTDVKCYKCSEPIHEESAVKEAQRLAEKSGCETSVLCCKCYDKILIEKAEDRIKHNPSILLKIEKLLDYESAYTTEGFERRTEEKDLEGIMLMLKDKGCIGKVKTYFEEGSYFWLRLKDDWFKDNEEEEIDWGALGRSMEARIGRIISNGGES